MQITMFKNAFLFVVICVLFYNAFLCQCNVDNYKNIFKNKNLHDVVRSGKIDIKNVDNVLKKNKFNRNLIERNKQQNLLYLSKINNLKEKVEILPINFPIGHISGLSLDETGRLIVFHRADRTLSNKSFDQNNIFNKSLSEIQYNTIYIIDPESGDVIESYGSNKFLMPHGLTTDIEYNIWVTDIGSHQVHKLNKNFTIVMSLGVKREPGNDNYHFCQPTDVAIASNGDIFVADGYCNSRIIKFDKNGTYKTEFGKRTINATNPQSGEFYAIHSITLIEELDLLCVADMGNKRIQCFSAGINEDSRASIPTGIFLNKAEKIGKILAIREKNGYLFGSINNDYNSEVESQLFVMDTKSKQTKTFLKEVSNIHSLTISDDGVIFAGQLDSGRIIKINPLKNY